MTAVNPGIHPLPHSTDGSVEVEMENVFISTDCGKKLSSKKSLKWHKSSHTGEILCDICNKIVGERYHLQKHMIFSTW